MSRPKKPPFKFDPDRKTFERQPKEPDKAWQAFVIYRDMGFERSLSKAAKKYKESTESKAKLRSIEDNMGKLSSEYKWVSRSADWDNELDKRRRRQKVLAIEEMQERHLKLATSMQGLGAIELQKWINKAQEAKASNEITLAIKELKELIDLGIRLERLNRDEPESVNKTKQDVEVSIDNKRKHMRKFLEDKELSEEVRSLANKIPWKNDG
jgi:hypothetical protein